MFEFSYIDNAYRKIFEHGYLMKKRTDIIKDMIVTIIIIEFVVECESTDQIQDLQKLPNRRALVVMSR